MSEFEKWYRFCMICLHSYKRKDDADTVYCEANENHCPYRDEIEMAERKDGYVTLHHEDIHFIDEDAERAFYESLAERKEE